MPTSSTYQKPLSKSTGIKFSVYNVMMGVCAVFGRLSARTVDRIAWGLAVFLYDVLRLRRKMVNRNLAIAFGDTKSEKERQSIARNSYYNFLLTGFEFLRSHHQDIASDIDTKDAHYLTEALAEGKGVYILCFHMGNWEAMGAKITRAFTPAHVVVKKVGGPEMDRFVTDTRLKNGFLPMKRQKKGDAYRQIKDALSRNEIVGFVIDQARPGEPKLPFFGKPAKTNTSFAAIWRKHPAPIVPSYITRHSIGKHTVNFFPQVKLTATDNAEADIMQFSQRFNDEVQKHVSAQPEQYLWMHNRWK